ncbi:uncharacterized protein [Euphorbia lathyris]|uniref:uncharacterized protein isoform X2 n=1 Tax=Euphorbia lathyris TaxID=212925 RepID=UPI00331345FD
MRFCCGSRRRRLSVQSVLLACALLTGVGLLILTLRSIDPPSNDAAFLPKLVEDVDDDGDGGDSTSASRNDVFPEETKLASNSCATVEQMGDSFRGRHSEVNLRVRRIIHLHLAIYGASRVRALPPEQFCKHGFVLAKASEAGFGNEMGKYPFGDYISYSNHSFTMNEIKHLWRKNGCVKKFDRHLVMRIDDFENPARSNVLCGNWRKWEQPIIWFQNTTNAVASQFFLKNVYPEMRDAASGLFGQPDLPQSRPNVFGELMKVLISPSKDVMEAISKVLDGGTDPDISLHMRMLMNRPVRAMHAAVNCIKKAMLNIHQMPRPRVVLVSDTPSFVQSVLTSITEFADVIYFDYGNFQGNVSRSVNALSNLGFRVKDWGPAPRWVAFVDFFLASRAKHAVVSGAHRRVGTTYAQLIAALAAANHLEENSTGSDFAFLSSFQSNLLADGLRLQIGWGHAWNRFAGPLSCRKQADQCAFTPLLPPAWWDGLWQSPTPRDMRRLAAFGIKLSGFGTVDEDHLQSFCNSKKSTLRTVLVL